MNKFLVLGIIISLTTISYGNDLDDALMDAVYEGNLVKVKELVENGADVNAQGEYGDNPLGGAAHFGYLEIVEYLVKNGADVNLTNKKGHTVLMYASKNGHTDIVEFLKNVEAKE